MRRRLVIASSLAATASLATGGWFARRRWPSRIVLGVGQPLSGPLAAMGQDMVNGAQMAADELNAAGGVRLGGYHAPLVLRVADDKSDADTGRAAAARLVDEGVVAAIAHLNSGVSMAAAPVYAQAGVPQLSISTNPRYTRLGLPTTLRLVANDDVQARVMGGFAAEMPGMQRYALVDDGTPFGTGLVRDLTEVLQRQNKSVVARRTLDDRVTEFGPLVAELRATAAQVLVSTLADFQLAALMPQLVAGGLADIQLVGADNAKTESLRQVAVPVRGVFASSPILDPSELKAAPAFLQAFSQRFGGLPNYAGHYAYDAVMVVVDALQRNATVDRAALLQRLKSFSGNAPVTGSLAMGEDGEQRFASVGVYRLLKGRWELQVRATRW